MLQKYHITGKERQNCFSNLTLITCIFALSKAAHLLFQGEFVGTDSVTQTERSTQQQEMVFHYLLGWVTHQIRKQKRK